MKKLIVALSIALVAASTGFAQTGAVYSLNVVGFQKVTARPAALALPGVPFEAASHELNDLIGDQLTGAKNSAGADRIFLWDASAQEYKKYFLKSTLGNQWVSYDDPNNASTNAFIYPADGFWIDASASSSQEVVLVGDVVNADSVTNPISSALNMISYPFSTPMPINDLGLNIGTAAKNSAGADRIFMWDAEAQQYVKFFLKSTLGNKWVAYTDPNVEATNVVDPNMGMWYDAQGSFTWTADRPYTLD